MPERRGRRGAPRRRFPDRAGLLRATRIFLEAIGEPEPDLDRDRRRTPERVAHAWGREILSGYAVDEERLLKTGFASRARGMVVVRDIPFVSVCVHHLLPFHGTAHVGYLPSGRIVGVSKVARLVDALARRLQLQERLGLQVVTAIQQALVPEGAACLLEAEHLCMTIRGARKRGTRVVTTSFSGAFEKRPALRVEFLRLASPRPKRT